MVENLARLAQFDSDPEVRRAAKLVFLEREGFDSPDVLSDVDQMHPTLDMQIHYIPNLARAKFREPWSELAGWNVLNHMEDFVDAGPNYRVLSDVLSSTRKGPGEDDFHSAADWLTADDDKTASPDGNVGSVESTGTEGTGLGRSSIGGTGNETITAVTSIDGTGFGSTSTGTDGTTIGSMDTDDTGSDGGVKNNTIIDISGTDGPNGSINPSTSGVNGTITGAKDTDDMDAISTSAIDTELLCLGGTKMDVDGADTNGTITRDTVADSAMEVGTGTDGCSGGANTGGTDGMDGARVVGRMCKASTGSTDDGMDVRMNEASTGPIDRTMDCSSTGANDGRKLGDVTGGTDDGLRGSSTSGVTDETGSNGIELLEVVGTKLKEESDGSSTVSKEEEQIQIDDDDQGDCSQV
ncbi:unnamed protein product [Bursaphelenchus okinawaensis]|uniref:Uncharacterized protein n=1 Tax=Bursaphelenchus okinawaensis TaxID=465554 RepID=A0A811KGA8_9BILA|nr:unnamed protein product [Bursaphelenchus okinawaensis]CAG9101712.1 unnamed protein product [Bursaphelenchus okinawaensis]